MDGRIEQTTYIRFRLMPGNYNDCKILPEHYEKIDAPEEVYNSTYSDRG